MNPKQKIISEKTKIKRKEKKRK